MRLQPHRLRAVLLALACSILALVAPIADDASRSQALLLEQTNAVDAGGTSFAVTNPPTDCARLRHK